MKSFEYYYQREFDYLRQLAKIVSEENPHLRDVLGGGDPDVERLFEGASVLTARLKQKIEDGFPELTRPLLQKLRAQPLKGLPATSIIQFDSHGQGDSDFSIPAGTEVYTEAGQPFVMCRPCPVAPLTLVSREIIHQIQATKIILKFRYTGKEAEWQTRPISLFLSSDEPVADILMLGLMQYYTDAELHHNGQVYKAQGERFEARFGASRLTLSSAKDDNWAPQLLIESLYLPHINQFLDLPLPIMVKQLKLAEHREFSVELTLNTSLPLSAEQIESAFQLHCAPVVNMERNCQVTLPFAAETARYPLPLAPNQGILHIAGIELKNEPGSEEEHRGNEYLFYPASLLTGMERYHPEYDNAGFYGLETPHDEWNRVRYQVVFYDREGKLMHQPPECEFICHFYGFEQNLPPLTSGAISLGGENVPEILQLKNIMPTSRTYPPITDSLRYWDFLSHYAIGSYALESVESVRQLLQDFDLYPEGDRPVSRSIRRMIDGISNITAKWGDRLIRGRPVRCLLITLEMDESGYTSAGEMYRFANALYQFFPFCLAQGSWLRMRVISQPSGTQWYLLPSMLEGYRSIM
ncbi:type VI secretion system baseplate subunit TssF [Xenorhabdus bovienii]|uniref:type VI secretion system baseplate subunit TssF n=1 Tax=Xenorhabdus bovienii TaxID=40576 RepID=UPI0023B26007|nr:type VI secretion system baseplate subunit TssF [Xenorhabdus bovienii]MDE9457280.1 type VI secretion system baseplate subunit TssF [Xenorhabdus bovienii]MDE9485722.1 type VI secretion system baseplate subunit TssF [Xenorhabdus bovienii]MDE9513571.1 type VI secretion system baseplate subunit TssF [Xenorhabdus bovienii]